MSVKTLQNYSISSSLDTIKNLFANSEFKLKWWPDIDMDNG